MAAFAVKAVSAKTNSGPVQLIKIISASEQVVAGTNYKLELQLEKVGANEGPLICEVVVFEPLPSDPEAPPRTLRSSSCAAALEAPTRSAASASASVQKVIKH